MKTVVGEINRHRRISIASLHLNEKEQKRQKLRQNRGSQGSWGRDRVYLKTNKSALSTARDAGYTAT